MRYLMFITTDESAMASVSPEEGQAMTAEYFAYQDAMAERGILEGGARLQFTSDATTVRVRDGEIVTTDGPFAETKEQIGGYYIFDCKDLDEAIEVAAKCPAARTTSVEVRPIWEM
jgi:hypothetical protein